MGGHDRFEGRGASGTKINITFFVGIDVLNIFHLTKFSKKNNIFQNNSEKVFSWHDPFRGNGASDDKKGYNFFFFLQFLSLFLKKNPYHLT